MWIGMLGASFGRFLPNLGDRQWREKKNTGNPETERTR